MVQPRFKLRTKTDLSNQIIANNAASNESGVFFSTQWKERFKQTQLNSESPLPLISKKINIYTTLGQELADHESLPDNIENLEKKMNSAKKAKCDWVVFRKLRAVSPGLSPYSQAPFLDLTRPLHVKKEVSAHLGRTERKLIREIGAIVIRTARTTNEMEKWFSTWKQFHESVNHFDEIRFQIYRRWIFGAPLPEWFRLITFEAGGLPMACGLFYQYDSVFYFFSPSQNHDEYLKKYGLGKLFVHKLIEIAKIDGCREFDFLQGAYPYKMGWNPTLRPLYQKIIPITIYGKLAYTWLRAKQALRSYK